ncbi:MAG TPA: ABC transporter permease, partial [Sphingobacteriaceae bacterium]
MFRNYLKTAVRNIWRYKGFSLINISSLSIGVTCCLIIGLFVWDELQYDRFVRDGDRIHRMYMEYSNVSGKTLSASVPPMFATHLQATYPEVESSLRMLMFSGKLLMEAGEKRAYENNGLIVDPTFFQFFPLEFVQGDPGTALEGSTSVVITDELARKYFGTTQAVGRLMKIDKGDYTVKGVLAAVPEHFHLNVGYLIPMAAAAIPKERMEKWTWNQFHTYIKLKPGTDVAALQAKFQSYINREINPQSLKDGRSSFLPFFQPLQDVHLKSAEFTFDNAKRGNALYVKGLTIIVFFVLMIACFNFVNLATARSFRRAKEIGVRKVIGADRRQLILQFTGETILFALLAVVVAAAATFFILPSLNVFTGKTISFNPLSDPELGLLLAGGALVIGILAGIYPALFMSGFKPIRVLKGLKPVGEGSRSSGGLRQGLVVVQFALSALLIVCTVIVYKQMTYLQKKDLGFNKDQILYFDLQGDIAANPEPLKAELLRSPGVIGATAGYGLPGDQLAGDQVIVPTPEGEKTEGVNLFIV